MKYYTVEVQSIKREHKKIFRGIKALSSREALEQVKAKLDRQNRWEYKVYLSKRRERRYKHSKHTNKLRRPWAVLAKNAKRQHFNVLNQWSPLHYHRMTYVMHLSDEELGIPPRLPVMDLVDNIFGQFTGQLLGIEPRTMSAEEAGFDPKQYEPERTQ